MERYAEDNKLIRFVKRIKRMYDIVIAYDGTVIMENAYEQY